MRYGSIEHFFLFLSLDFFLRPVLFHVQVITDISNQDYVYNKRMLQCTGGQEQ